MSSLLTGGGGADTFDFGRATGDGAVRDFVLGQDIIQFDRSQFSDFSSVMAASTQVGSDTVIQLSGGQPNGSSGTLTLEGSQSPVYRPRISVSYSLYRDVLWRGSSSLAGVSGSRSPAAR